MADKNKAGGKKGTGDKNKAGGKKGTGDKDKAGGKKGADEDGADGPARRVELVDDADRSAAGLPGYLGVGMLGGVILGFGPLRDAAQGNGPFEDAMLRFVACLIFCTAAASFIGRVLDDTEDPEEGGNASDGATGPADNGPTDAAGPADAAGPVDTGTSGAAGASPTGDAGVGAG